MAFPTDTFTPVALATTTLCTDMGQWAGSEASHDIAVAALAAIQAKLADGSFKADTEADSESRPPFLLTKQGNIGIISIRGPLVNSDSPYLKYFGVTGYNDISRAANAAATDSEIEAIALDMATPGGSVAGLNDTANRLAIIDKTIKPVHTYTGSMMASAGLWLGASARSMAADSTAITGSLGVVTVHREASKMMADIGIKETVVRSGKYKQQVNQHEPLTAEAKAHLEGMLDETYKVFMTHVAKSRGMEYAKADAAFGQGREFVGQQGVDAGLIDRVTTFDKFLSGLQAGIDKKAQTHQNAGNYSRGLMTYKTLSAVQVEAMKASGLSDETIKAIDDKQIAANAATAEAEATAKAKIEAEAAAALLAANAGKGGEQTALIERVAAQAVQIANLTVERDQAKTAMTPLNEGLKTCKDIVTASISTMRIALGQSASDMSSMSPTDLVALHGTVEKDFKTKFPTGQVSATSASEQGKAVPNWLSTAAAIREGSVKA